MSHHRSIGTRLELTRPGTRVLLLVVICAAFYCPSAQGQCEVQQLLGDTKDLDNDFGQTVAIRGDVAVVGDTLPCSYPSSCAGVVYVFRIVGGMWTQEAVLVGAEPDPTIQFGAPVAIGDNVIVVGARCANAPDSASGAAHVYRYDPNTSSWVYEAMLTASDGDGGDAFGHSLAIDADVVVIGAVGDENQGLSSSGSAYVFRFDGVSWIEEAKLVDPYPVSLDALGASVAVRGDVILVGSPISTQDNANESVLVFRYDGSTWMLEVELAASDILMEQASFGCSVSLAEDVLLIGAFRADEFNGAAYVFRFDGDKWRLEASLVPSDPDQGKFGLSVGFDIDGNTALIGAPADSTLGFMSGAAYVFRRDGQRWVETTKLLPTDGNSSDLFGQSVSLSQDIAVVGARKEGEAGSAYVFAGVLGIDCNGNQQSDVCDIFDEVSQDENANGIPDECEAIGDLNGDGDVGIVDLLTLLALWGPCPAPCPPFCSGDLDGDCTVGIADFLMLLANWG